MRRLLRWIKPRPNWIRSSPFELPAIGPQQETALRQWTLVAGGLALILSRASEVELAQRFRCSQLLHLMVRRALLQNQPVRVPIDCLADTMHEIAELADPVTKRALLVRFQVAVQAHRGAGAKPSATRAPGAAMAAPSESEMPSPDSITPSSHSRAREEMLGQLALEDASRSLRQVVATARASNFGEPPSR